MHIATRHLRIAFSEAEALQALDTVVPGMGDGFNINTSRGDLSLLGEDAKAVMSLVRELIERRVATSGQVTPEVTPIYNHAFTVAFQLSGSTDKQGEDVTAEQMRDALRKRINTLMDAGEMLEAVGAPFDTYEE